MCYIFIMFIPTAKNTSTVTDMRVDALGLIKDVEKLGMKYIFQKSKPKVVMMNMVLFERMVEKYEDWLDQERVYELEKEDHGIGVSLEDVAKEFGIKLHNKV